MDRITLRSSEADAGARLDAWLAAQLEEVSRSAAARLCEEGRVTCGGKLLGKNARLTGGETVEVLLPDRAYNWLMRYEQFGMVLLVIIISVGIGSNALDAAIRWVFDLFCRIVGF